MKDIKENLSDEFGLLIQGPLISVGRSGLTGGIGFSDVNESHVIEFNCIENIQEIFDTFSPYFKAMVCVIWENEDQENINLLQKKIGRENTLIIQDQTRRINSKGEVIPGNNKYKQFFSSMKGVEFLINRGCKYAIKSRSDQRLDYLKLSNEFLSEKNTENKIMIAGINKLIPDHLHDFYFCADSEILHRLFHDYLVKNEIFDHVQFDIFYSFARSYGMIPRLPYDLFKTPLMHKFILKFFNENCLLASKEVFSELIWRGELITNAQVNENFYQEDLNESDLNYLLKPKSISSPFELIKILIKIIRRIFLKPNTGLSIETK
jgi:hypothetical protein